MTEAERKATWFFALHRGILPLSRQTLRPYLFDCMTEYPAND